MSDCPLVWIFIGVSGSGKTKVGRLFAEQLECDFLEGDRRHPKSNIVKMRSQIPLQDQDRHQWLLTIEDDIRRSIRQNREMVMTCSALKISYRKQLACSNRVQLVWLDVPEAELRKRLRDRVNHYMQADMLCSQVAAFEPIRAEENVIAVDGMLSPPEIVNQLLQQAADLFPMLNSEWWQR